MTNLFTNLSKNVLCTVNGPRMDRHYTENGPIHSRQLFAVLVMLWVKLVNFVNFVMQIFVESAESAKPIYATSATYASANFVGKESNESTVMDREWSRIPSCLFRYGLDSHLSRLCLASLICLCMLTVGVGQLWGAVTALTIPKSWASSDGKSAYTEALGCTQSGLGKDYSTSGRYLRFDDTGDYLQIQIASAPAYVSYSIQGNGFSSGTFKVQESANDTSWSDLATYSNSISAGTKTHNLAATTRYIRFYFTTHTTGNVGMGTVVIKARTSVTLDKNGGSADGSAVFAYGAGSYESFTTVTRTGYTLNGYYTASSAGTKVLNVNGSNASSSVSGWWSSSKWSKDAATAKLYAQWSAKTYGITLDRNGASSGSTSVTMTYNSSSHTALTAPTRSGYTFDGWYDSESNDNGTGNLIMNASGVLQANAGTYTGAGGIWILDDEVTLYAKWTAAVVCSDPDAPEKGSVSSTGATITFAESGNYDIYYSTSSTAPTGSTAATTTVSSASSKALTGLAVGTTYYYWARKDCGGGSKSDYVAGSPTNFTTTVPAPTGLSMTPSLYGVTFGITDANNVNNYEIYYSTTNSAPGESPSGTATTTTKSKDVTGLPASTTYYCWVRAKGPNANSSWYSGGSFATLTLSSISVSTAPTTTKYLVGENFDPTGLVITRTYSNSTSDTYTYSDHTAEFSFSPATNTALTAEDDAVTITYGGQTVDQSINVYTVTVNKVNMSGTAITADGVTASCSGRTLSQSVGSTNYKFEEYAVTAGGVSVSTNTITGTPTGNVTINAKFHDPITVTKGTGTGTSTFTVSPTGEVKYGSSVTVTCAATDGYKNPWTLTVTPSDGATYDETGSTGSITISNITKNITVDLAYVDKGCTTHKGNGVDEGSSYSNVYGPVNDNWKYGARQILYTKSDLGLAAGKKGTIKSISFQYQYSTAISDKDKVKIYMANTNLTSLSTSNYVTSFTEVYSGSMNCSNGWNEIELDTDFDYNGVGNLLVVIEDYSGKYTGSSYAFYYHEATTGIQLYNTTDGSAYDITAASTWTGGTAVAYRPNTKFCIEEDDMVEATVNWYVNGSIEHTQTDYPGTAFDEIPTPDSGDCGGEKEFVGWYTDDYTHASVAPAFVNPTVIPEGGADYYAVFATVTPTNNYQQITSEGDLVAGAKYLIVGNSTTTYNALPVDAATSLSSVSPSGTPLTISNPGATLIWTLEGSADAWKIKSTSNNKYLQISDGSLTFETSTSLTFSVDVSSNIFTFTSSAASGNKKLSYYHGGKPSQFNAYSSANTVYVFKQVVTATNYATTCAETYDVARAGTPAGTVTGGTFTVSPSKQAEGKSVTLSATPDLGYSFGSWTVTKTEAPYTDITSTNVAGNTLTMPAFDVTVNATFTPTPTLTATGGDLSSTTLPFGTSCEQDEGTDKTFVLNGYSLTNDVTLTISGTDASMFSVKSPSSPIDKGTGRINDQTVTVTFTPTSTGAKTATLTIASSGASSIVLTLSGTAIKHYKVHYWNSGTDVHQESVLAGEDASATWDGVDDEDGCDTETYKYFVGWSKTNVGSIPTTTKPTIGETYTSLSSDVNYYAVWTNVNPNGWERYESATIAEGDYLVVEKSSTTYYTMKNTMTGTRMDHGVAVLSGSLISAPSSELSYDWNDFIWHIAKPDPDKAEYTFYNADESKYVASTGTASQVAFVASPSDGKELFTYTYDGTNKTYNWTNKYNSGQSVNATFRDANSGFSCYASQSHTQYLYYRAGGTAKYITNCCDKNVTLATNSPSHGSITFSPEGPISTCGADAATRQTTMTVTPDEGYYLSTWSTSGVTPASLSTDIAYGSTSNSGAQATTVTFTQNTTTGTYTANATFSPIPVSSLTLHAIKKDNTSATIFDETGNNVALSLYPTEGKTASPADPLGHTVKIEFGAVLPANALNKGYTWSATVNGAAVGWSSNSLENNAVLEFNKNTGKVVAKAAGTAEIIITADDGSGVTAKVTITVTNVALSSLNVAKSSTTLYVGESEQIAVTYDPVNTTTKGYTTGSYTYVTIGRSNDKITLTGKAVTPGEPERVTLTSSDAGAKTATIDVTVKPLPKVTFVDNLQGKTDFSNWGSDGVVSSTVTDGVVTHTKPTPSHTDISDPGASYNACERNHLHLVGWIESTWADAHPSATHSEITGANASNGEGTFLEAGADFNVETYNGNTYYAVWSQVE